MSGQDEKLDILDRVERKYKVVMKLLIRSRSENQDIYSLLPKELARVMRLYEEHPAISNSMKFEDGLRQYWREINVAPELKPKLEQIVNMKGLSPFEDFFEYEEGWKKLLD